LQGRGDSDVEGRGRAERPVGEEDVTGAGTVERDLTLRVETSLRAHVEEGIPQEIVSEDSLAPRTADETVVSINVEGRALTGWTRSSTWVHRETQQETEENRELLVREFETQVGGW
jgi:hypothetical protein